MLTTISERPHAMYGVSLILAPLLQALSSFFWIEEEYGVVGGSLLVFSIVFWIPALVALFELVKTKMPNYAAWGLLIAIYGFISGAGFAFLGVFAEVFGISHDQYIADLSNYPVASNLLLFQAGPLTPLSFIVLGMVFMRTGVLPLRFGLLILLGGITFPLSRISRIEWAAHIADLLLLAPLAELGWRMLLRRRN